MRPPLRWVGGKTQLLKELLARVPANYGAYLEPFCGGAALFFALNPTKAVLNDANKELINLYKQLRDDVDGVINALRSGNFINDSETFYRIRASNDPSPAWAAARTIYLNRCCFNGLYRVNKSGGFNAPFGKYANPTICNEENLREVSLALQSTSLLASQDFRATEVWALPGDFVYLDPPYVPLTASSNFTSYTAAGFGLQDQIDLRDMALRMKRNGVHVLLSNSAAPLVTELYGADFTLEPVQARRNINSKGDGRGAVTEYLIR